MELIELVRAHARVLGAERNLNALGLQYAKREKELRQYTEDFERLKIEAIAAGFEYDEEDMVFVEG